MTSTSISAQPDFARFSPRNPWHRLLDAVKAAQAGQFEQASRLLDSVRYHVDLPARIFDIYARQVAAFRTAAPVIDIPQDYLRPADPRLRVPFRRVEARREVPNPYPPLLALPPYVGLTNDTRFIEDAASVLATDLRQRMRQVHVFLDGPDVAATAQALAVQEFNGAISLTVCLDRPDLTLSLPEQLSPRIVEGGLRGPEAMARLAEVVAEEDAAMVLFLSGRVVLDEMALSRAAHLLRASDRLAVPLVSFSAQGGMATPLAPPGKRVFTSRYPYREMQGLNMAVSTALLRRVGLPETRFYSHALAARELAFRMVTAGAYLSPLQVSRFEPVRDESLDEADGPLYVSLCPNHWDRKADGRFERPRVSVYIPAYNAEKYLRRAIDSVLEQDVQDLEVCVADDGACDGTTALLETCYADEPRLRWETARNGGIGHASNRAIEMARAPYIGQLDSDDCLKPGAVRRLMEYLDDHPEVSCVYGSCERIDAGGAYIKNEYNWPVFSREKMMITSIAHHFRMFRRAAWERTTRFREDIVNAVDYDLFLKLSETGPMHHIDEVLYQRRWHGENTSNVNEGFQTANTHRAQREALKRQGLDVFWDVKVPDPSEPRKVTYTRRSGAPLVLFWPDYSWSNPYQHMLYREARQAAEICAGDLAAALEAVQAASSPGDVTFHLHWLNFLFADVETRAEAQARVDNFVEGLTRFVELGGRLVWTIHNTVSHDTPYADVEVGLSARIAALAHTLHLHSAASIEEVARSFDIPRDRVRISPHGSYIGAYPDFVSREAARRALGISADDDVILFSGQIRPYKGVGDLLAVFRRLLVERPRALLLLAGEARPGQMAELLAGLLPQERTRVRATDRFVSAAEMQLFFRAADMAVYPYQSILTSGSLMLALSFGTPVVIPAVGMTRDVLEHQDAGMLYEGAFGATGLEAAIRALFARKDAGQLSGVAARARALGERSGWPNFTELLVDVSDRERCSAEPSAVTKLPS